MKNCSLCHYCNFQDDILNVGRCQRFKQIVNLMSEQSCFKSSKFLTEINKNNNQLKLEL